MAGLAPMDDSWLLGLQLCLQEDSVDDLLLPLAVDDDGLVPPDFMSFLDQASADAADFSPPPHLTVHPTSASFSVMTRAASPSAASSDASSGAHMPDLYADASTALPMVLVPTPTLSDPSRCTPSTPCSGVVHTPPDSNDAATSSDDGSKGVCEKQPQQRRSVRPARANKTVRQAPARGFASNHTLDMAMAASKRKAPDVDWRSIDDPAERRKQRRLAKNRRTAAVSRDRKKHQWVEMEERLQLLTAENAALRAMLEACAERDPALQHQLASLTKGASNPWLVGTGREPASP